MRRIKTLLRKHLFLGAATILLLAPALFAQSDPTDPVYDALLKRAYTADATFFTTPFEAAVKIRVDRDDVADTLARIAVHRDLATIAKERGETLKEGSHIGTAIQLALHLEDADLLIPLNLRQAKIELKRGRRFAAHDLAESVWEMAKKLERTEPQIEAGTILANIIFHMGETEKLDPLFEAILELEPSNLLEILEQRAMFSAVFSKEIQKKHWGNLAAAAADSAPEVEARAWDRIGELNNRLDNPEEALSDFQRADELAPDRKRPTFIWRAYVAVISATDNQSVARSVLNRSLNAISESQSPALAADLYDALAVLDANAEDFKSAYDNIRYAQQLREKPRSAERIPKAMMSSIIPVEIEKEAAELAAVQNALREAELSATQLKQRNTYVLVIAGFLLAGVLGVAYHFKRRAADALADAKDAAELRAERTHWEMLRYQLNPHFLFNALTSVSGLAMIDPEATRRTVNRLSQFCRLALERTTGELRSIETEMKLLSAFLDVEKVGMGDRLELELSHDPKTADWLLPPLFMQPLVENALKYGSRTSGDSLRIRVKISLNEAEDELLIEVANTGDWVEENTSTNRRRKVGLANVRDRLNRLAPDSSNLTTIADDGWVKIFIKLPDLRGHELAIPAPV